MSDPFKFECWRCGDMCRDADMVDGYSYGPVCVECDEELSDEWEVVFGEDDNDNEEGEE